MGDLTREDIVPLLEIDVSRVKWVLSKNKPKEGDFLNGIYTFPEVRTPDGAVVIRQKRTKKLFIEFPELFTKWGISQGKNKAGELQPSYSIRFGPDNIRRLPEPDRMRGPLDFSSLLADADHETVRDVATFIAAYQKIDELDNAYRTQFAYLGIQHINSIRADADARDPTKDKPEHQYFCAKPKKYYPPKKEVLDESEMPPMDEATKTRWSTVFVSAPRQDGTRREYTLAQAKVRSAGSFAKIISGCDVFRNAQASYMQFDILQWDFTQEGHSASGVARKRKPIALYGGPIVPLEEVEPEEDEAFDHENGIHDGEYVEVGVSPQQLVSTRPPMQPQQQRHVSVPGQSDLQRRLTAEQTAKMREDEIQAEAARREEDERQAAILRKVEEEYARKAAQASSRGSQPVQSSSTAQAVATGMSASQRASGGNPAGKRTKMATATTNVQASRVTIQDVTNEDEAAAAEAENEMDEAMSQDMLHENNDESVQRNGRYASQMMYGTQAMPDDVPGLDEGEDEGEMEQPYEDGGEEEEPQPPPVVPPPVSSKKTSAAAAAGGKATTKVRSAAVENASAAPPVKRAKKHVVESEDEEPAEATTDGVGSGEFHDDPIEVKPKGAQPLTSKRTSDATRSTKATSKSAATSSTSGGGRKPTSRGT